jgi:hypothetical protein
MKLQVSAAKLRNAIERGLGRGTGDQYQPWIQVRRGNGSPFSNQAIWRLPGARRASHFLSLAERNMALLCIFLGATDVREQYPLFSWPHAHPEDELHGAGAHPPHMGMECLAADLGIPLSKYPGTSTPIVLTLDMMLTVRKKHSAHDTLVGVSCKPKQSADYGPYSLRVLDRLELDRRYCTSAGIDHLLLHPEMFPRNLLASLLWIAPASPREKLDEVRGSKNYSKFLSVASRQVYSRAPFAVANEISERLEIPEQAGAEMLRIGMWTQDLDVDLDRRISLASPFEPGGRDLRQRLGETLFGGLHV